jgi:Nucleoside 2-deoxyribosyltransferase
MPPSIPAFGNIEVYLAGPIAKGDWRHSLVPGLRGAFGAGDDGANARTDATFELPTQTKGFSCVGPWFISCDHGCSHGPNKHGAMGGFCDDGGLRNDGPPARRSVFQANLARIRRADAIFCLLNREEGYGSNFELGYAAALGKRIYVGFPPGFEQLRNDTWFAAQACSWAPDGHVGDYWSLWSDFVDRLRAERYRQLAFQHTMHALRAV